MKLTLNGEAREFEPAVPTVLALLEQLAMAERRVAVEVNGTIVRRAAWEAAALADGDVVEIVQFVGGG
ncbi:MAG: sulfur carrier protein ThiS [Myxococcota bacterium]